MMSSQQGKQISQEVHHEDRTLTYFRAPNIRRDCREGDELFGPEAK